jgi:hypothetical protein
MDVDSAGNADESAAEPPVPIEAPPVEPPSPILTFTPRQIYRQLAGRWHLDANPRRETAAREASPADGGNAS